MTVTRRRDSRPTWAIWWIIPILTIELIVSCAAEQQVIPAFTAHFIISLASINTVASRTSLDLVVSSPSINKVVAVACLNFVIAVPSIDHVVATTSLDLVVAASPSNGDRNEDILTNIHLIIAAKYINLNGPWII